MQQWEEDAYWDHHVCVSIQHLTKALYKYYRDLVWACAKCKKTHPPDEKNCAICGATKPTFEMKMNILLNDFALRVVPRGTDQ